MVDNEALWSDARRWKDGAVDHVLAAAQLARVRPGERILDVGCGVGGPARTLVDNYGVTVVGIANSENMLRTAEEIDRTQADWNARISLQFHDCQQPYDFGMFDVVWSMNMLYRVADKRAMLTNIYRALAPGGRLMVEDWMLTRVATPNDLLAMQRHHSAHEIARVDDFEQLLEDCHFDIQARQDLGHVGRTHFARHFTEQFNRRVRPRLEADFPDRPVSGKQMADEWVDGIEETIRLYQELKMTYLRLVVCPRADNQPAGGIR